MQQAQYNYGSLVCGVVLLLIGLFAGQSAFSAGIANPNAPDPILSGGPTGPCEPHLDGAELTPQTDVNGNPVAGADLPGAASPVPAQIAVPLPNRDRRAAPGYVSLDGKALAPLLNPAGACH